MLGGQMDTRATAVMGPIGERGEWGGWVCLSLGWSPPWLHFGWERAALWGDGGHG